MIKVESEKKIKVTLEVRIQPTVMYLCSYVAIYIHVSVSNKYTHKYLISVYFLF